MPKIFIHKVSAECLRDTIFGVEIVCVLSAYLLTTVSGDEVEFVCGVVVGSGGGGSRRCDEGGGGGLDQLQEGSPHI